MYKTISVKNQCDDFQSSRREFQLAPSVNTKFDARFNKIELFTNGNIKILMVFKFEYLPARMLETLTTYGIGETVIFAPELHKDIRSLDSIKIMADIYKHRMEDFVKLAKQKFLDKFEFPLIGVFEVTEEESIKNIEVILSLFLDNAESSDNP